MDKKMHLTPEGFQHCFKVAKNLRYKFTESDYFEKISD